MDFIDEQIIHELKEDSRLSMSELSRRVHLSAPAVRERVRQLEEQDIIKRYTIELNQKKLGYPIEAIIEATIKNNRYEDFKKQICQYSNVDFCYRIAGEACFMLKARFHSFEDAEQFIDELQLFAHSKTSFVFSKVV
ncbi:MULTISPECIES: Lrp/AsnC family transcriptional regulator [Heyndrickxia]|uniref:Lrp/AsnC family transcriptional regulator, leucine-responsive regulatory protein n=1 Tax=Heyndrickxia coagulans DSM 1 = ATCC 7050 TaxID=1121088 RepID=A0A8B4BYF6_HEYCO|nr:Lrp/AsnC family transcriptional regulator [Heyndrickxia coagulans]NWN95072.1 Lrp/AsnC family transcriptional regulator [Bacillus sp. (in: firmicutes)]AJH77636.1 HTH-type transcriptional regulator lrpC [Heyndrickxia coagulans DSM 1 = ATCC 7050]MCR2847391.1 Lrp/AsnC family transcriptional regulator [Heyndrickxia coagulans]MDR4225072.1 Lrp/AsnC family transcriptional regulator [Heyndrickxia coagulans DSM 1 = ATCC 7050]MDT9756584.1 Lrp/AsnC family transcriptional regulator [Heyndrickxia coagula